MFNSTENVFKELLHFLFYIAIIPSPWPALLQFVQSILRADYSISVQYLYTQNAGNEVIPQTILCSKSAQLLFVLFVFVFVFFPSFHNSSLAMSQSSFSSSLALVLAVINPCMHLQYSVHTYIYIYYQQQSENITFFPSPSLPSPLSPSLPSSSTQLNPFVSNLIHSLTLPLPLPLPLAF